MHLRAFAAILGALLALQGSGLGADSVRGLTVDDLLRTSFVLRSDIAPHTGEFIYEAVESYDTAANLGTIEFTPTYSGISGKIFTVDLREGTKPRLLFEQEQRAGYRMGPLSPGGDKLAIFRLLDGELAAGVVELTSRRVSWFPIRPEYSKEFVTDPVWISDEDLIFAALSPAERPAILLREGLARRLNELWQRAFLGQAASVSVLESHRDNTGTWETFRSGALVRVSMRSLDVTTLHAGRFVNIIVSPNGRYLAGLMQGGLPHPAPDERPVGAPDDLRHQLVIFDLTSNQRAIYPCSPCSVKLGSLAWSRKGNELTFSAKNSSAESAWTPYRYSLRTQSLRGLAAPSFHVCSKPVVDVGEGYAAAFGLIGSNTSLASFSPTDSCVASAQWYLVSPETSPRSLFRAAVESEATVVAATNSSVFIVYVSGWILRVRLDGSHKQFMKLEGEGYSRWQRPIDPMFVPSAQPYDQLTLKNDEQVVTLDLVSGATSTLQMPRPQSVLHAITPDGKRAIFSYMDRGTTVFVAIEQNARHELFTINQAYANITPAEELKLSYKSDAGFMLDGCLMLPPGAKAGERFPMIVEVYPDVDDPTCMSPYEFSNWNFQLWTSHGYAVLVPGTPRQQIRTSEGPTKNITRVVLAGVDAAVRTGRVDASKVALLGISQGMNSALQIIAETDRFKAAVVAMGISDFASHYGSSSLRFRFNPDRPDLLGSADRYEDANSSNFIGPKPWEDPHKYIANSPVYFADRINTPLLIIHSDFDFFSLGQSEQLFVALQRLRKEALYLTYWGEGHVPMSPANVRDMWQRMFSWYDSHLHPDILRRRRGDAPATSF